jgi:hypothetical protein
MIKWGDLIAGCPIFLQFQTGSFARQNAEQNNKRIFTVTGIQLQGKK